MTAANANALLDALRTATDMISHLVIETQGASDYIIPITWGAAASGQLALASPGYIDIENDLGSTVNINQFTLISRAVYSSFTDPTGFTGLLSDATQITTYSGASSVDTVSKTIDLADNEVVRISSATLTIS